MNSEWQQFLVQQGAHIEQSNGANGDTAEITEFEASTTDLSSDQKLTAITDRGVISVVGPDAKKFLQGQLTCNLDDVDEQHSVLGALCNYQGKTICNFRVLLSQDTYYLTLHSSITDTVMNYLKKYIAFAKAEMTDVSDQFVHIGCWGPGIEQTLAGQLGDDSLQYNEIRSVNDGIAVRYDDETPRFELICAVADGMILWAWLSTHCEKQRSSQWVLQNIRCGIPEISLKVSEQFIPQMLNLDLIDAISFKKGCYTGQEIIARSHYLGKQKRRLFRFQTNSKTAVHVGAELYFGDSANTAGTVVNSAGSRDGQYELLAVSKSQSLVQAGEKTLYLDNEKSEKLSLISLPYAIPNE